MTFEKDKEFACERIMGAKDNIDLVEVLLALYYNEYSMAPKTLRGIFDDLNAEARKLAIQIAKKLKVDEIYDSIKEDKE